ncbi:cytochrome P450 4C1-like [Culicoides brevitarsis]|uniref:cytochrome P450 4C1-like n=1 Tax=Culicoides brevitarsis TaxID=469753 RepID=UPI00307C000A
MSTISLVSLAIRTILGLLVLKPVIEWMLKRWRFIKLINKIPGLPSYPFIGSTWIAFKAKPQDIIDIALARPKFYEGGINSAWLGPYAEVRVNTAELAQQVLTSKAAMTKSEIYRILLEPWIGDGLIVTSDIKKWFHHRRLITTTFYFDILTRYCEIFQNKARIFCEVLDEKCDGEAFDIDKYFYRLTFDAILETAFGVSPNIQKDYENEYLKAAEEYGILGAKRASNPLLHNDFLFSISPLGRQAKKQLKILHDYSNNIINNRRRELFQVDANNNVSRNSGEQPCFLDLLLRESQTKPYLTDKAIREEVDTFIFAGHDTTATALSWMALLIGNHPEVQERIYEEQISLFGNDKSPPTQQDLRQMEYLEAVMKECLRLQPSVVGTSRGLKEDIELGGYTVPAGCMLTVHIYQVHREEKYFPNPEKFIPDRFLPENSGKIHPYSFIPFSGSHRSCIGQRFAMNLMKITLATLCRNYKMTAVDSLDKVQTCREIVARPYPGINVKLEKR